MRVGTASGAVFDYTLASVELAELYFEDGCPTRVREIVGELFPVFQHLKNDRLAPLGEVGDALRLFQRACMAEALSERLFRDVKRVLVRRSAF